MNREYRVQLVWTHTSGVHMCICGVPFHLCACEGMVENGTGSHKAEVPTSPTEGVCT